MNDNQTITNNKIMKYSSESRSFLSYIMCTMYTKYIYYIFYFSIKISIDVIVLFLISFKKYDSISRVLVIS